MREIKFRAWVVDEYEEDGNTPATYKMVHWFPEFFSDMSPVTHWGSEIGEDVILMQYTGLKDKNAVEVYEGDICQLYQYRYLVRYVDGGWELFLGDNGDGTYTTGGTFQYTVQRCEVVGNKFENPELLK